VDSFIGEVIVCALPALRELRNDAPGGLMGGGMGFLACMVSTVYGVYIRYLRLKCHNWVALPLRTVIVDGPPFSVPRYLHLDLGRQTQRSVARFRLHALRVETRSWEHHDGTCDKSGLQAIQDEKRALLLCPCTQMCSLRLQLALLTGRLVSRFTYGSQNYCQSAWSF